ncbi:MAG: hypothetical protein HZC28_20605 [Spirochaetes bacterium]|nr:hypothetical protein [Spirochaetota bacterium]
MSETLLDFAKCPSCHAQNWEDMHELKADAVTRYRCIRCGYTMTIGKCSACGKKAWTKSEIQPGKVGRKPVIRYRCSACGRTIGLIVDRIGV